MIVYFSQILFIYILSTCIAGLFCFSAVLVDQLPLNMEATSENKTIKNVFIYLEEVACHTKMLVNYPFNYSLQLVNVTWVFELLTQHCGCILPMSLKVRNNKRTCAFNNILTLFCRPMKKFRAYLVHLAAQACSVILQKLWILNVKLLTKSRLCWKSSQLVCMKAIVQF